MRKNYKPTSKSSIKSYLLLSSLPEKCKRATQLDQLRTTVLKTTGRKAVQMIDTMYNPLDASFEIVKQDKRTAIKRIKVSSKTHTHTYTLALSDRLTH